jgi:hypothetical protein
MKELQAIVLDRINGGWRATAYNKDGHILAETEEEQRMTAYVTVLDEVRNSGGKDTEDE